MRIYKNEPFTDESDSDKLINGINYIFCDLLYALEILRHGIHLFFEFNLFARREDDSFRNFLY